MRRFARLLFGLLCLGLATAAPARPLSPESVPEPLQPWIDWVLWDHPDLDCPMLYNDRHHRCVWPGRLELTLTDQGGRFTQTLRVYRDAFIELPGSSRFWPQEVHIDGQPALLSGQGQIPRLQLVPGDHRIEGRFRWEALPESLPVPDVTGLVLLSIDGKPRQHPERKDGRLWLRGTTRASADTEDRLHLEVYRKVVDDHPLQLVSLLRLQVSGRQREIVLGHPLLEGFVPVQIQSTLPARLEPDGALRVQVRPGAWELELQALHPDYLTALTLPRQPVPWPGEEVWSFQAEPALRLVEVEGTVQVDPRQTRMPPAWHALPAYRMEAGQTLRLQVLRRGDPQPEPDSLRLQRELWLDFDGRGYTLRDHIAGQMTRGWRLSVGPELQLGRAVLNGEPQFITRLDGDDRAGLEVRRGQVDLLAESRIEEALTRLPASGWEQDFQQLSAVLHLPPGWRLLAAGGMDAEHDSWLSHWTLYDLFLVCVIAAAVGKLWGWRWALPALLTLVVIWQEPGAPRHIWLYLLALTALLRVVPAGRFQRLFKVARLLGLILLAGIMLPFLVDQARTALYPQLARPGLPPSVVQREREMAQPVMDEALAPQQKSRRLDALPSGIATLGSVPPPVPKAAPERWQTDPNARIQTGPGLPAWQWQHIPLAWNGPVPQHQRIRLILAEPRVNLLLHLAGIPLLLLLAWRFLDLGGWRADRGASNALLVLFSLFLSTAPGPSQAAYPSPELLAQLERRLTEAPQCLPRCADIQRMRLELEPDRLTARLAVDALQRTAIPLPIDDRQQSPVQVLLDGEPADALLRDDKGLLWIPLEAGAHEVLLVADLPEAPRLQLPLPLPPHRVEVVTRSWAVEGLRENQVPEGQLHLSRLDSAGDSSSAKPFAGQLLPPFVRVERTLHLDLEWSVVTRVVRVSPPGTPILLHVPLLPGEAVITESIQVKDHQAQVNMAADARQTVWRSRLPISERLQLTAPRTSRWVEQWRLELSPHWHARLSGLAPVHHQDRQRWLPTWKPWPGEQVELELSRPLGIGGRTHTIDSSRLSLTPGQRATDAELEFHLRSSQGGRQDLRLPEGAQLLSVRIDDRTQPIRQEGTRVSLPVHPGEQSYRLSWRQASGITTRWHSPPLDLGLESVNSEIQVRLGQDRWVLFTSGPRLGPAVLFWGELSIIVLAALILGRMRSYSPLGTFSWLLLGIGLSQVWIGSGLLVAASFFAFGFRRRLDPQRLGGAFNLLQVGLVLLALLTLATLFWAVQQGLLGLPQMQIGGNGSSAYRLNWYQDRNPQVLPVVQVYSVPLLVYRLLMLAWALWLAFALLRWIGWAWQAFSQGGRWIEIKLRWGKSRQTRPQSSEPG